MGKTELNAGGKKAELARTHVAARGERFELQAGTLPVGYEPCGKIYNLKTELKEISVPLDRHEDV